MELVRQDALIDLIEMRPDLKALAYTGAGQISGWRPLP
jgi:hypothetical protein